ncbi:unnamed protein product [Dicrocoelium dendriticum]|nr:unnamed protein product [Dicrocoelium dendriticum]
MSCAFNTCEYGVHLEHRMDGGLLNIRRFGSRSLVRETTIRMLLFADDCALFAHTEEELQCMTTILASTATKFGLSINTGKTVCLFQPAPGVQPVCGPEIRIVDEVLQNTSAFCYLGSTLSSDLRITNELRARVAKASAAFGKLEHRVWKNHHLTVRTKVMVYKSMVLSVLIYGSETWTLYRKDIRFLERFHQQCLRRILRIQWWDNVPDTDVIRRSEVYTIDYMLLLRHLRWLGHVRRMDATRIPKQLLYGQLIAGGRNAGKPKLRYQDNIKVSLSRLSIDLNIWEELATNRRTWRDLITCTVAQSQERQMVHREIKRAARKHHLPSDFNSSATPTWSCSACGRVCFSPAGLASHQRGHDGVMPNRWIVRSSITD